MQDPKRRRPGEAAFATLMALASLFLLWNAFGISRFEALSAPGAIPMATTFAMLVTATIVLVKTLRAPVDTRETFFRDILPPNVILTTVMLVAYAFALKPIGFLPTSAVFLIASIRLLGRRSWGFSIGIGLLSLLGLYLVFRIVFTVLMPAGIVPEGEILAWFHRLPGRGN